MNYTPGSIPEGINSPPTNHLKEALILTVGLTAIILVVYALLGWGADYMVDRLSIEMERKIAARFFPQTKRNGKPTAAEELLQRLLSTDSSMNRAGFYLDVACDQKMVNAIALPGGRIVLFGGLLKAVKSENELAMVLGHEIGHFAHRDHLRRIGRALLFQAAMAFFNLERSGGWIDSLFNRPGEMLAYRFSRKQEESADLYGADRVAAAYGHAGGMGDFFNRLKSEESTLAWADWFSTHPFSERRVEVIEEYRKNHGWRAGSLTPLPATFVHDLCPRLN